MLKKCVEKNAYWQPRKSMVFERMYFLGKCTVVLSCYHSYLWVKDLSNWHVWTNAYELIDVKWTRYTHISLRKWIFENFQTEPKSMIAWWIDIQYSKKGQSKYIPIWTVKCYAYCIEHVYYEFFNLIGVGNGTEKPINDLILPLFNGKTIQFLHLTFSLEWRKINKLQFEVWPVRGKKEKINKTVTFFVIKKNYTFCK